MTPTPLTADALLIAGRAVLDPFMERCGFRFVPGSSGSGSGGPFATGEYSRGTRRLLFSCRWSLGLVEYRNAQGSISHEDLMRVTLEPGKRSHYPGFGDDPVGGFRQLLADLEAYGADFLVGSDEAFGARVQAARDTPRPTGLSALDVRTS